MFKYAHCLVALFLLSAPCYGQRDDDDNLFEEIFELSSEHEKFDWEVFKKFVPLDERRMNFMLSPISLKLSLQILYEGASGPTADQLKENFAADLPLNQSRSKYKQIMMSLLENHPEYDLQVGNRMYLKKSITAVQSYKVKLKNYYSCDVIPFDSRNLENLVNEANEWVSKLTKNNIQRLIDKDDMDETVVLLLNVLYFRGTWEHQFLANKTTTGKFYTDSKNQVEVQYMTQTNTYPFHHSKSLEAKMIKMPYQGDKYAMYVILPDSINGVGKVLSEINSGLISRAIGMMSDRTVKLVLPKFKFNYQAKLMPVLEQLGIRDLFTNNASLSRIALGKNGLDLKVSNIIQKSGVDVNEIGTVGYASTVIQLVNKFGDDDNIEDFAVTRSFVFFIEDGKTKQILFAGKVGNPSEAPPLDILTVSAQLNPERPKTPTPAPADTKKPRYFNIKT